MRAVPTPTQDLLVGRSAELAVGERAIARVAGGEGTLLMLSGDAGVGKTRLARAIGEVAAARGMRVVWGRVWESGGAPSYWPWIQVFRALGAAAAADEEPFAAEPAGDIDVAQARFATFDRAEQRLVSATATAPVAIVLDDLHAADVPSLLFLQFLARDLARLRLLVIVTVRQREASHAPDIAGPLTKIAREGTTIALDPLSRDDVAAWIRAASSLDAAAAASDADQIHTITEGNALFIHELLRVRGALTPAAAAKLPGLRALLDEHIARLSDDARVILEVAAVTGRDIDVRLVATVANRPRHVVQHALRDACELGVVVESSDECFSFSHMLLRERLYADLAPARRAELHGAAADALVASGHGRDDLATAAHHLFESMRPSVQVGEVAREAARAALARLAFEEAARLCERALARHTADDELAFELEVALGEAVIRAGNLADGREHCARAAARARRLGSAERQARAALAFATEQAAGAVDAAMVATLREALAALDADTDPPPSDLRARVLARLAAALAPPRTDSDAVAALAHGAEALAIARRLGDPDALLYALHHGGIGLGYLLPFAERARMMGELYELADAAHRPLFKLHLGGWHVATLREQGRLVDANTALDEYARLVDGVPRPHYRWRVPMLKATLAALASDFAASEQLAQDALEIAEEGAVQAGRMAWMMWRMSIAQLRGDPGSVAPDAERLEAMTQRMPPLRAWLYAATGRRDQAVRLINEVARGASYFSWALFGAEVAALVDDDELAERAYAAVSRHAEHNSLLWGPSGVVVFGQAPRAAGDLATRLGRSDEAQRWYDAANALGTTMQAPALIALATRGHASAVSASAATTASAVTAAARAAVPATARAIGDIEVRREGEMWRISSSTGVTMTLKDSKGLAYLGHLVSRPRQELHVTQLVDLGDVSSDAGTVLDARAKAQYKRRLDDLRDQLEEARAFGDFARAERVEAELETIAEQLAAAVGLGGRDRKVGSHAERARINIQRRLRDVIDRISEHDLALGRYLAATIKTGMFCAFMPL